MDYIKTAELDINLEQFKKSCLFLRDIVLTHCDRSDPGIPIGPATTQIYNKYNLLLFPFDGFYDFYVQLCKTFNKFVDDNEKYYIQCWVNVYKHGEYLDWHKHFEVEDNAWHGFFCVDAEDSKTSYKLPNGEQVDVPSKNGKLVISKSAGDLHRTYPWPHEDRERLTVAFDIVPWHKVGWGINHWVPLVQGIK